MNASTVLGNRVQSGLSVALRKNGLFIEVKESKSQ